MKTVLYKKMARLGMFLTMLVCAAAMTACGGDDDAPPVVEETLSVNVSNLSFTAEGGTQSFNIVASGQWDVFGQPEWINVSPQKGQGNTTVTVTINTSNLDSAPRTATLTVTSGDKSVNVEISQAGAYATCTATVKNLMVLAKSAAFQLECTADVKNVRCGWATARYVQSQTDQELIDWMKTSTAAAPKDGVYIFEDELQPDTEYYILTLAYDKNDKMGKLCKQAYKTKSAENQSIVSISNIQLWTNGEMSWEATPNNNGNKYYSLYINGMDRESLYYPTYLAWIMNEEIKKGNSSAVQKHVGSGEITENKGYKIENNKLVPQQAILHGNLQIVTWGENLNGDLSGVVNWDGGFLDLYSVRPRMAGSAQKGTFRPLDSLNDVSLRGGILLRP